MQTDPQKPYQPKKPVIKNWVPQAKRTAASVKKLKKGVDQLRPWAKTAWEKQPHRTEIPYRVLSILTGLKRRPVPRDAILYALTATLFKHSFRHKPGNTINLEDVWQQVILRFQQQRPDVVQWLNSNESKSAFFWQIAGHVDAFDHPIKSAMTHVLIMQRNRGPRKGEFVQFFKFRDGSTTQIPKDWQPDWPTFLFVGAYWQREPVCNYTVGNMCFSWPCPDLEQILQTLLWEPPLRVFKDRKKKK